MKRYLYYFEQRFSTKNKLEKEVADYLHNMDRFPVNEDEFVRLQKSMKQSIESLNNKYHRCTPVTIMFNQSLSSQEVIVRVGGFARSRFLKFEEL